MNDDKLKEIIERLDKGASDMFLRYSRDEYELEGMLDELKRLVPIEVKVQKSKKKKPPMYYTREFLNEERINGLAAIVAEIGETEHGHVISISDCEKTIELSFSCYSDRGVHNAINKARKLRDILIAFTNTLEERYEENYERYEKNVED